MLRKWTRLLSPDANTDSTSSTESADNQAATATAEQSEQQTDESTGDTEESTEGEESTEETQETTDTEATETETQEEQTTSQQQTTTELDKPEDAKLPFHQHPRFNEVIQEKNRYKQEVEQVKPLVEQSNALNTFMRDNHISTQEFQNALQYLAALRTNPAEAFKMLQPTYDQLAMLNGDRLPADLQAKVAATTLSEEDAREIAKARAQQTYTQWQQQRNQQAGQQSQAELVQQTMGQWTSTKQTQDPDLKQGSPLWEQTQLRINAMPVFKSPQEAWAGAEKAYGEAKKFLSGLQPRSVSSSKRPPQSQATNNGNGYQVDTSKSVDEQAKQVARLIGKGARPSQIRYT